MSFFVVKIPLNVSEYNYKKLESRFEVARVFYNAILAEAKNRKLAYRNSDEFRQCKELYKKYEETEDESFKLRANELREIARKNAGFYFRSAAKKHNMDNSVEQYGYRTIRKKGTWIAEHIDCMVANNLSLRAYTAVRRNPKAYFKRYGRDYITSVEGKNLTSPLTWQNNAVKWSKLTIPGNLVADDVKHAFVIEHSDKIRYVRLLRMRVGDKWHYYAELVCEGVPPLKKGQTLGVGRVGVDFGPSNAHYYTEHLVKGTINLAGKLDFKQRQIRRLSRKLDRQRRANNPNNYDQKGRAIKGARVWHHSKKELVVLRKLRDLKRQEKAYRRNLHGQATNLLRSLGDDLRIEKLEYKKWQMNKRFSRSVTKRAPAMLVTLLKNKYLVTDGKVHEINTYKTKLSQTCPSCGNQKKKKLWERWHYCEKCGLGGDRDLVSALLAICVNPDTDEVNFEEAKNFLAREMPTQAGEIDRGLTCDLLPTGG